MHQHGIAFNNDNLIAIENGSRVGNFMLDYDVAVYNSSLKWYLSIVMSC